MTQPTWTFASPDRRRHDRHLIGSARFRQLPSGAGPSFAELAVVIFFCSWGCETAARARDFTTVCRDTQFLLGGGPSLIRVLLHGSFFGRPGHPSFGKTPPPTP